jgi:aspartate carbamoyltransferase regulatory subunit
MPALHTEICPNDECRKRTDVYVEEKAIPPKGKRYSYECPYCKKQIQFRISAVEVVAFIPAGAAIAQPLNQ